MPRDQNPNRQQTKLVPITRPHQMGENLWMEIPWPPKTYSRAQEQILADKIRFLLGAFNTPGRVRPAACEGDCRNIHNCLRNGCCDGMTFYFPEESDSHSVWERKEAWHEENSKRWFKRTFSPDLIWPKVYSAPLAEYHYEQAIERKRKALTEGIPHETFKANITAVLMDFFDMSETAPDMDDPLARMVAWVIRDGPAVVSKFIDDERAAYESLSIDQHILLRRIHDWYAERKQRDAAARKVREPLFLEAIDKFFRETYE